MKNRKLLILFTLILLSTVRVWSQAPAVNGVVNLNGGCWVNFSPPTNSLGPIYNYQYSLDNGTSWISASPAVTEPPLAITGLTNCNVYAVKIRAQQLYGNSAASTVFNVIPKSSTLDTSGAWTIQAAASPFSWNSVAFGNGLFVAVSSSGTGSRVMTSPDGVTWTLQTTPADQPWKTITYGNGIFLALANGYTGAAMTSTDGINWTLQSVPTCDWESVTYGNGTFVAVASGGWPLLIYSTDGINWNYGSAPDYSATFRSVTYGNGTFVLVGEYGSTYQAFYSSDGINWSGATAPSNDWKAVAYGGGKFVALCASGTSRAMVSTNGINWSSLSSSVIDNNTWTSIAYGNGIFVAVGQYSGNKIMWSPDGEIWIARTEPASDNWSSVTCGNGKFVAVASSGSYQGQVMTCTNSLSSPPDAPSISVAASGITGATVYFTPPAATGSSPVTYYEYSTDTGTTWVNPTPPVTSSPFTVSGLTSGGVMLRAVSSVGSSCPSAQVALAFPPGAPTIDSTDGINGGAVVYFTSPTSNGGAAISNYEYSVNNGATWITPSPAVTSSPLIFTGAINNCTSGAVQIRAVNICGAGSASASANFSAVASQFTAGTFVGRTAPSGAYQDVVYGNGLFVAVGENRVMTSPDGINWTQRTPANANLWFSVTYGNGLFVAVASSGNSGQRVMTSADGITWTAGTVSQTRNWRSITFANGTFVAVSNGSGLGASAPVVMYSTNGINWNFTMDGNNLDWNLVLYGNGKFWAFSANGQYCRTSTDGIIWSGSTQYSSVGNFTTVNDGVYANGKFVLVGSGLFINGTRYDVLYSSDGLNWNYSLQGTNFSPDAITYGGGTFITLTATTGPTCTIHRSSNAISWTLSTFSRPSSNSLYFDYDDWSDITFGANRFVAVNRSPNALYSVMTSNTITKSAPAPTITSIAAYHTSCFVSFSSSPSALSEPPTNYQYSLNNGTTWTALNPATTTSPFKISGLTNGVTYNVMIRSVSAGGNSCPSNSLSVTPIIGVAASAPVIDSIQNWNNAALLFFTPPTSDGGSPITNYQVSVDSGLTWITRSPASLISPLNLTGINNCSRYPVFIRAVNATGGGASSNLVIANPRYTEVQYTTSWASQSCTPTNSSDNVSPFWTDIAYGNGVYVVVGSQGTVNDRVMTSTDAVTWTKRTAASLNRWSNVVFGNGIFVAGGEQNPGGSTSKIMTSTDGITWTLRTTNLTNDVYDLIYANGKFWAMGTSSVGRSLIYSTDGINWTAVPIPNKGWSGLFHGNGLFILHGTELDANLYTMKGFFMTSTDGINWTERTDAVFTNKNPGKFAYATGKFVATCQDNGIITSTDGLTWTHRGNPMVNKYWHPIAYGNGMFTCAAIQDHTVMNSTDGINWTVSENALSEYSKTIFFANGMFISVNQIFWAGAANPTINHIVSLASGGVFRVPDAPAITQVTTSGGNGSISFSPPADNGGIPISNYEYSVDNGSNWITPSPAVTTSPLAMPGDSVGDIMIRAVNTLGTSCPSSSYSLLTCYPTTSSTSISKCPNELPYSWNGLSISSAGSYTWTGTNAAGCDSIATLVLTLSNQTTTYDTVTACGSYTWSADNITYTQSGDYTYSGACLTSYLTLTVTPQPSAPTGLACYETATLNSNSCQWEVTGTQPAAPTGLACYETATFNGTTCLWEVTGTQPAQPGIACYETATWNGTTCQWDITGTQPSAPTGLACYETANFNGTTCQWEVTGMQPAQPTLACYESATFNSTTCQWDVTGTQPAQPGIACYETATFNGTTCQWDVTGSQPAQPSTACYETATWNGTTCQWDVTGTPNAPIVTSDAGCNSYTWTADGNTYTASGTYSYFNNCQDYVLNLTINTTSSYYVDADGDGYGAGAATSSCTPITGSVTVDGDCDDTNASANPGASEVCNSIDDDCDGSVDDNIPAVVTPGSITGTALSCRAGVAGVASYSIAPVAGAGNYVWSVPSGFTITGGQGTSAITVAYTAAAMQSGITGQLCVTAGNACTSSPAPRCTNIEYQIAAPVTPPTISGPIKACAGETATFSISAVARATSYTWTVPTGMNILSGQGSNVITAEFVSGFAGGNIGVTASNICGTSPQRNKQITQNSLLAPTAIQGPKTGLCSVTGVTYTVPTVTGATGYTWGITGSGATIVSGQGSTSIVVDYAQFSSVYITVQAVNGCGSSLIRSLFITGAPGRPGTISGSKNVCRNATEAYSIATVDGTGPNGYAWTTTGAGNITSGQGTKNISITWFAAATGQGISVSASNACGTGEKNSLSGITVSNCPRLGDSNSSLSIEAYPNPADDRVHLVFNATAEQPYRLRMVDMAGKLVAEKNGIAYEGRNEEDFLFGSLQSGVYILEMQSGENTGRFRLVVN